MTGFIIIIILYFIFLTTRKPLPPLLDSRPEEGSALLIIIVLLVHTHTIHLKWATGERKRKQNKDVRGIKKVLRETVF